MPLLLVASSCQGVDVRVDLERQVVQELEYEQWSGLPGARPDQDVRVECPDQTISELQHGRRLECRLRSVDAQVEISAGGVARTAGRDRVDNGPIIGRVVAEVVAIKWLAGGDGKTPLIDIVAVLPP